MARVQAREFDLQRINLVTPRSGTSSSKLMLATEVRHMYIQSTVRTTAVIVKTTVTLVQLLKSRCRSSVALMFNWLLLIYPIATLPDDLILRQFAHRWNTPHPCHAQQARSSRCAGFSGTFQIRSNGRKSSTKKDYRSYIKTSCYRNLIEWSSTR